MWLSRLTYGRNKYYTSHEDSFLENVFIKNVRSKFAPVHGMEWCGRDRVNSTL
jgi:hypothetical protein